MTAPTTDVERALVGAVLQGATGALDLIEDTDLGDPRLRVVTEVARQLLEAGVTPDPVTVLSHAQATATVTGADEVQAFALLVADLVMACPVVASARWYAVGTLDGALRRRVTEAGARLAQAAEGESLGSMLALVDAEQEAVRKIARRRADAATDAPRLRAVSA